MTGITRRQFARALGGAAAWPLAARAQQTSTRVIGFLHSGSAETRIQHVTKFREGLKQTGFVEGQNVAIEYRWADGYYDRLPVLAADLVRRQVAVIATAGGTVAAVAAKSATATIPIVFEIAADPVRVGLVDALNRPGGNATGVVMFLANLEPKRLQLLHEVIPRGAPIGAVVNPRSPNAEFETKAAQSAAATLGHQIIVLAASSDAQIEEAFAVITQNRIGAIAVLTDPFLATRAAQITALAARHRLPAIYAYREFPEVGGLMSYGNSLRDTYQQAGIYTGRVLKGEKPSDLPVQQSTRFEFVINIKTAKALGISMPPGILAIADEIIE